MPHAIIPRPDATEENLAILGHLRSAIDSRSKLGLLIDLRASFRPHRDWKTEEQYLLERHGLRVMQPLLTTLQASGVSLRDALSVPLLFKMNAR